MSGRDLHVKIPANNHVKVSAAGAYAHLKSTTGTLGVEVDSQRVDMVAGDTLRPGRAFPSFIAHNDTGADITAVFVVGDGDFRQAVIAGDVGITRPSNFAGVADVALTGAADPLLATDATRSTVRITALLTNVGEVRIGGDGSTGAAQGTPLQPGETLTLSWDDGAAAALYAKGTAGDKIAISIAQD